MMLAHLLLEAGVAERASSTSSTATREAVDTLLTDPRVGAVQLRRLDRDRRVHLFDRGGRNGKRCQALCGAKNHMVVMPDADMDPGGPTRLMGSGYGSAGERCMAISVAVAVGDTGDKADREAGKPKVFAA